ncbi:Potassium channel HX13_20290 [Microbacterium sp. 8M]|uniref:TMEM175 family protein n=1 Tax=Microbacterium sp. 8M TaxID=2653153 RepID=UPI0012F023ED|nr:TMEM175 family protein [Microbacterium sp. 8M]VXC15976.1 Potassium channel HX13_20290 [Microbacterium sp. 8M]
MTSSRLEAFSDGVLAIIITVMVLGLAVPKGDSWTDLVHTSGLGLLTYLLSFVYVGIYWSNHHHLFQLRPTVDGVVLWANLHLLLWLSLYPFTTAWITESHVAQVPTIVYGLNLLGAALAYSILQRTIERGPDGSRIREAFGRDLKGIVSPLLYLTGLGLSFVVPWLALVPYVIVAVIWLVPDRRVERYLRTHADAGASEDEEGPTP